MKEHASSLKAGTSRVGPGGAMMGKIQEVNDKMKEVRMTMAGALLCHRHLVHSDHAHR